jgi:uncharacterized protein
MKNRIIIDYIKEKAKSKFGRIIVLTGARQTGKTTLIKESFGEYKYISLEDPVARPEYTALSAPELFNKFPAAILDEVQKAPSLVESVKAVYDQYPDSRYILLGSSQILLLSKIRESLSGRVSLIELYSLTLPEMLTGSWQEPVQESKMIKWFKSGMEDNDVFKGIAQADDRFAKANAEFNEYLQYGSMPAIIGAEPEEKYEWLRNYIQTYLERDLRDLAQLRELEPFVSLQKILAGLTGQTVNYENIAKLAGITSKTVKKFISYLEISYQVILLKPWFRNLNKRMIKSPKVHFLDPGIQKVLVSRRGEPTGSEFESAVISEILRQIKSYRLNEIGFYHLRTFDGREVDLILETDRGYVPIEIKMSRKISASDAANLKLAGILDKPIVHSFILSNDRHIQPIDKDITALPAAWFLS